MPHLASFSVFIKADTVERVKPLTPSLIAFLAESNVRRYS
jgi:hypothetical protein